MASRHQGRHKPRHHTHKVKPAHIFRTALPPLPTEEQNATPAPAPTESSPAVTDERTSAQTDPATLAAAE